MVDEGEIAEASSIVSVFDGRCEQNKKKKKKKKKREKEEREKRNGMNKAGTKAIDTTMVSQVIHVS